MNIKVKKLSRTTHREGVYLLESGPLRSPFHPYSDPENIRCVEAYKAYLYRVLELNKMPMDVALKLSKEREILVSGRWTPPTKDAVIAEVKNIVRAGSVVIGTHRTPDPGHGLAAYLNWKYPAADQLELSHAS
ncbi:hypothetical protein [Acaryochloris sp. 'Moss Beach']|uniref:hypothetical protein n=2 Tax=Acaryochloris TaxID=155977 RepID=UPI001F2A3034|nr:hypothetical protein [Acaryochloris sp. 'Moss Beach']